ncbi:hypothetical protein, partial [Neptuniibacter sp.]|uniref:hypothetical protein n=1 Tax=Neptuniibacter sp. TaxID=1962643 RepID=UPI00260AF17E
AYDQGATNCSDDWAGNDHGEPNRYWGLADNRTESKINGDLVVVVEAAGAGEMARAVLRGEVEYDMSAGLTPGSEGCGIEQKPIYLGYNGKMSLSIPSAGEYGRVLGRTSADKVSINIDKVWVLMADTFDPWTYDTDGDGFISKTEYHAAVVDYNTGTITEDEKAQVQTLFIDGGVFS